MKKTSIGGQAVMEGVMMKNLDRYAVAVRKPDHEIEVMTDEDKSLGSRYAVLGLPIIRGVVNFGESLYIGLKTLSYSSSFYEEEDYEHQLCVKAPVHASALNRRSSSTRRAWS